MQGGGGEVPYRPHGRAGTSVGASYILRLEILKTIVVGEKSMGWNHVLKQDGGQKGEMRFRRGFRKEKERGTDEDRETKTENRGRRGGRLKTDVGRRKSVGLVKARRTQQEKENG